jgi:hypothetical protein
MARRASLSAATAPEPVGLAEIARRSGVKLQTAQMWNWRGLLPPPRWTVSGKPAWDWHQDIVPWFNRSGRA